MAGFYDWLVQNAPQRLISDDGELLRPDQVEGNRKFAELQDQYREARFAQEEQDYPDIIGPDGQVWSAMLSTTDQGRIPTTVAEVANDPRSSIFQGKITDHNGVAYAPKSILTSAEVTGSADNGFIQNFLNGPGAVLLPLAVAGGAAAAAAGAGGAGAGAGAVEGGAAAGGAGAIPPASYWSALAGEAPAGGISRRLTSWVFSRWGRRPDSPARRWKRSWHQAALWDQLPRADWVGLPRLPRCSGCRHRDMSRRPTGLRGLVMPAHSTRQDRPAVASRGAVPPPNSPMRASTALRAAGAFSIS
jgi:hypothetical protein